MESPKLDAALRLELHARLPPANDTTSDHEDHQPYPQCRENGPSLTSPETSREDGARCCPDSRCQAFPGLGAAFSFLFPRLPPRARLSDWLIDQKVVGQRALVLAPPPRPADWTAESGVTLLCGARTSQSGARRILQTGEVAVAEAESREKAKKVGATLGGFRGRCGAGTLEGMRAVEVHKEEKQFEVLGRKNRLRVPGGGTQKRSLAGAGCCGSTDLGEDGSIRDRCEDGTDAPTWLTFDP